MSKNNQWSSRIGFLLATAGAAIGLGNLWKFPYLMGRNGGFPFLIAYLFFILLLGLPVMMLEMSLGRHSGKDAVGSYQKISPRAGIVGLIGVIVAFIILSYYSVIGGWILKYIFSYLTTFNAPASFDAFKSSPEVLVWFFLFMAATALICAKGVSGIEKASKFMMPTLFICLLIIILRSVTLPGAKEGLKFMFLPTETAEGAGFSLSSVSAALGQVFYSLSLCMGITITYGSYLNKKENIPKSCFHVAAMDTALAILAGVAIFPAVFSFGQDAGQGPSLIFSTLPSVFEKMGRPTGPILAILFFILVFFAAITSAIALLEVVVSYVTQNRGLNRAKVVPAVSLAAFLVGVPSALSFGAFSWFSVAGFNFFDIVGLLTDNLLLPLGGLLMCWFVGWRWKPAILVNEMKQGCPRFRLGRAWIFCVRFLTPLLILAVTISGFTTIYQAIAG